jgi:hypothetical protein
MEFNESLQNWEFLRYIQGGSVGFRSEKEQLRRVQEKSS